MSSLQAWDVFEDPLANVKCDFLIQNLTGFRNLRIKDFSTLQVTRKMASNDNEISIWQIVHLFDGKVLNRSNAVTSFWLLEWSLVAKPGAFCEWVACTILYEWHKRDILLVEMNRNKEPTILANVRRERMNFQPR